MNNVNVVYTPWSNLKKTADMDVGQIGFHRQKDVSVPPREGAEPCHCGKYPSFLSGTFGVMGSV